MLNQVACPVDVKFRLLCHKVVFTLTTVRHDGNGVSDYAQANFTNFSSKSVESTSMF